MEMISMKKILTISTDHQLLELMESQISSLGFELDTIESGQDLLNKINAGRPDVLVVDFILGDENAAAVCHQISSGPDTHGLPIIILSDMPGIEHIAEKQAVLP